MEPAPINPNPPAFETAEASLQPLHHIIPACMMGYSILKSFLIAFISVKLDFYREISKIKLNESAYHRLSGQFGAFHLTYQV